MPEQGGGGNRGRRGPSRGRRQWQGRPGPAGGHGRRAANEASGPAGGGGTGSLPHRAFAAGRTASLSWFIPRKVEETREDYEEGMELWKEGDPESARDALRYALSACHANLWAHVALGRIALTDFRDPTLARGHFGYAFELGQRALPRDFSGRLAPERPANRPFYEALDGLVECLKALGQHGECERLRELRARLSERPELSEPSKSPGQRNRLRSIEARRRLAGFFDFNEIFGLAGFSRSV